MGSSTSSGAAVLAAALILSACGGSTVPHAENANAVAAISAAEAAGAAEVPEAALHVKMAKDGVAQADRLVEDGEDDAARATLERATADAELASTLTSEQKAQNEANAATDRVEKLRLRTTTF